MVYQLLWGAALCVVPFTLLGCADKKLIEEYKERIRVLEKDAGEDCQKKCKNSALYGRWSTSTHGHQCMESTDFGPKPICMCSASETRPKDCISGTEVLLERGAAGSGSVATDTADVDAESEVSTALAANVSAAASRAAGVSRHGALAEAGGSPRHTVNRFCDKDGLRAMHGGQYAEQEEGEGMASSNQLESAILNDISKELETNNVDKMAKEIFTFYVCVRWIPEGTFWEIAKQELAASLVKSIVDHEENLDQAVAELYQRYKYVPLLCSQNLEVWRKTEEKHHTYFGQFREDVKRLAKWLEEKKDGMVHKDLVTIDQTFCGGNQMNAKTCNAKLEFNDAVKDWIPWASFEGTKDKWRIMQALFHSFEERQANDEGWRKEIQDWKAKFPYHSFIDKPGGMASEMSPTAEQRFLVCFGKRVASELHRRPNGQHIMTDQNNIGCHGWWDQQAARDMLNRMVELWKPPTCQLSEMVYAMKKEILAMFVKMNERLFDALPTMLMDEQLDEQDMLDQHMAGPGPYAPQSAHDGAFVDGMRVACLGKLKYPPGCEESHFLAEGNCELVVKAGKMGTVVIVDGKLHVLWGDDKTPRSAEPGQLHIMPHGWEGHKSMSSRMRDLVAGLGAVADRANAMFASMFRQNYQGLSVMMSESVSKWIVCPIREDANLQELDSHLGVEDAAFQDFRKEAYSKWTGYEAKVPGEECKKPDFLQGDFGAAEVCEISELHADHVERYFDEAGDQEAFICPLKPDLRFDEQLTVLSEKSDMCFLRMTNEQARHYGWQYRGDFPARRQNDQMENPPRQEFELVKLLKVPEGVEDNQVSFGRYCPLDELLANPRFCDKPPTFNPWPSADAMAAHLAGSVAGLFGVGAAALQGSIAAFQANLTSQALKEGAATAATVVKEKTIDGLFGTGRLLHKSGKFALAYLSDDLPGASRRKRKLEEDAFGTLEGGAMLHRLSFQRAIGASGRTSNSKDRFERYVVSYPCGNFDPALQFSIRREWGQIARRMVREASKQAKKMEVKGPHVLDYEHFGMLLRGEARVFEDTGKAETENKTFFELGAAIQVSTVSKPEDVQCSGNGITSSCEPADRCQRSWTSCVPKTVTDPDSWLLVKDQLLAKAVGALDLGQAVFGGKLSDLHGIKLALYCGEKKAFGNKPGEGPSGGGEKLLECLRRGVKQNAQLRAKTPWKLYYENEVVVVAVFDEIVGRWCQPSEASDESSRAVVCGEGAVVDQALDRHLGNEHKKAHMSAFKASVYRGLHSGAGYPNGAPREVLLKPEDILEAADLLLPDGIVPHQRNLADESQENPLIEEEMA
ncbi:unnamed protein product [Prorocentrum cordatum]|uniref:Uncharacterized protein n=1 Tax=Prorocentrum cordatum TaxID=2364126 RepID=A0ABN9S7E2_9DINO|nr:unnamed protein product [Polarella glacialis]